MDSQKMDLSFLDIMSDSDSKYKTQLLELFLDVVPKDIALLHQLIHDGNDYDTVQRKLHALKPSFIVVKYGTIYEDLSKLELLSKEKKAKDEMIAIIDNIYMEFKEAEILINKELNKII